MNTPYISVIVPVYNAEKWLRRCVESILNQTFEDFELILVDDGSTDGSSELCDTLSAEDPRIKVIHQPNGGVSAARNTGIKVAQGKYLCFVDADDMLPADALNTLWRVASKYTGVDAVCGNIVRLGEKIGPDQKNIAAFTDDVSYIRSKTLWEILGFSACGKLVRRTVVTDNNVWFAKGIKTGEDPLWNFFLQKRISSVAQCRQVVYQYCWDNESSAMHDYDGLDQYISRLRVAAIVWKNIDKYFKRSEIQLAVDFLSITRFRQAVSCNPHALEQFRQQSLAIQRDLSKNDICLLARYSFARLRLPLCILNKRAFDYADRFIRKILFYI